MAPALNPPVRTIALGGAVAGVIALILIAAGPGASSADAAGACRKWGGATPRHLSARQARKALVCIVNRRREHFGRRSLDVDGRLSKAAMRHTRLMRRKRCFSHHCPGESDLGGRLRGVHYILGSLRGFAYGENIGVGGAREATPREMVRRWMHSPGHRANILKRSFRDIGVGFVHGTVAQPHGPGAMYTADFGFRLK